MVAKTTYSFELALGEARLADYFALRQQIF